VGKYVKQTIASGQTITSTWGNTVQGQFEDVVGLVNNEVTQFIAAIISTDTRTVAITRTAGLVSKIELKDGATVVVTYNFIRTAGNITSITEVGDGKTITYTINRTNGLISSITKGVV
jgi:hypothetical protein